MRKLVIAFASVACAACAQAAAVLWTGSNVYTPGTTTGASGYVAYLFNSATLSTADAEAAIKDGTFSSSSAMKSTTTNAGNWGVPNIGSYGAGDSVTLYTVLFDAASFGAAEHYVITSTQTIAFTSGTGSKPAAFTNIGGTYSWQNVPEPTSAMLLLLGVAGLALKRKQK